MRAVEETKMNVSQLKEMEVTELVKNFSKDVVLSLFFENFKSKEIDGHEIFQLFVRKLLAAYGTQLTKGDWIALIGCLKESFQRLLNETLDEKLLQLLASWFREAVLCLQWLHTSDASILPWPNRCLLLGFVLFIVIDFLTYYKENKNTLTMQQLVKNVLMLHNEILKWLEKHADSIQITNGTEAQELHEVVDALCAVGEQTTILDFKSVIKTWKVIIKLLGLYAKSKFNVDSTYSQRAMNFLLRQIRNNMQTVYTKQTMEQPLQQIEKYLKVTNFYIKLLQRLIGNFAHEKCVAIQEFCKTYIATNITPAYFQETEIAQLVEKHVLIGLEEAFSLAYKHPAIVEYILQKSENIHDQTTDDFILPFAFLRVIITQSDSPFIVSNVQNCIALHKVLSERVFLTAQHYSSFVELYAALALLSEMSALRKHLRRQMFDGDFCMANSSMDILHTMLNYVSKYDANAHETLREEFQYWHKCNDLFTFPCDQQVRRAYVQQMLCQCHDLCQANARVRNGPPRQQPSLARSNCNFLLAVGLKKGVATPQERLFLTRDLAEEILTLLNKQPAIYSMEQFNKMLTYVELSGTSDAAIATDFLPRLLALIDVNYNNRKCPTDKLASFANATFKFVHARIRAKAIDEQSVLQTLQSIEKNRNRIEITDSVYLWCLLETCCRDRAASVRRKSAELLKTISSHARTWQRVFVASDSEEFNSKRPRWENARTAPTNVKTFLQDFSSKSTQIVNLSPNLDRNDCALLRRIVNDLNVMLANKQ